MSSIALLHDGTEPIGVLGSPSSTGQLTLELLDAATRRKLVGELVLLPFVQDGVRHYALGQITEIVLRNVWKIRRSAAWCGSVDGSTR
jgi:hypothetical protein